MWNGVELIKANRYFASSKTCSNCRNKKETLKLSERIYTCEVCNHKQDRDLNAAINLANYSPTQKPCESKACGERVAAMQSTSKKHEILSNGYESNIKY
jgi:transposase